MRPWKCLHNATKCRRFVRVSYSQKLQENTPRNADNALQNTVRFWTKTRQKATQRSRLRDFWRQKCLQSCKHKRCGGKGAKKRFSTVNAKKFSKFIAKIILFNPFQKGRWWKKNVWKFECFVDIKLKHKNIVLSHKKSTVKLTCQQW